MIERISKEPIQRICVVRMLPLIVVFLLSVGRVGAASPTQIVDPKYCPPDTPVQSQTIYATVSDSPDVHLGGKSVAMFTIGISHAPAKGQFVKVNYKTVPGNTENFIPVSGQLTFQYGGPTSIVVDVQIKDTHISSVEYFYLDLTSASGANIARNQGKATIYPR
jgi:hypothetical protein